MASITFERNESTDVSGVVPARRSWLVGPWFDALFIANVAWPLLVLLQFGDGFAGRAGLEFWQIYFVTTPHRWITMLIVFLDRERFSERRATFLGIAIGAPTLCLVVFTTTGALTCLMTIEYLWNAWHFASQHHGIYRIYARRANSGPPTGALVEKWAMRVFLLYVTLRVATATWPDLALEGYLRIGDGVVLAVAVWLVVRDLFSSQPRSKGRMTYLVSVMALYSCLLWAVHERRFGLILTLATASALFHAIEYLALVSWSVQERHAAKGDRLGILSHLMPRWGIALGLFIVVLGAGAWLVHSRFLEAWLLINVNVAFLHFAYDGLIWRRRASA